MSASDGWTEEDDVILSHVWRDDASASSSRELSGPMSVGAVMAKNKEQSYQSQEMLLSSEAGLERMVGGILETAGGTKNEEQNCRSLERLPSVEGGSERRVGGILETAENSEEDQLRMQSEGNVGL